MDQTLSLSWTSNQAVATGRIYRIAFIIALFIETAVAVVALFATHWFAAIVTPAPGQQLVPATEASWIRAWAILLLLIALFQLPAADNAPRRRWLNFAAVATRAIEAVAYAVIGFIWLALLEALLFLVLLVLLYRYMIKELMSRP
jgi:hypothetical protein